MKCNSKAIIKLNSVLITIIHEASIELFRMKIGRKLTSYDSWKVIKPRPKSTGRNHWRPKTLYTVGYDRYGRLYISKSIMKINLSVLVEILFSTIHVSISLINITIFVWKIHWQLISYIGNIRVEVASLSLIFQLNETFTSV